MTPFRSWLGRLFSKDRRKHSRRAATQLVAYYWDGGTPQPHRLRDITSSGAYLLTEQRWYPGTIVTMTLQRTEGTVTVTGRRSIAVQARVVRAGSDGVGLEFLIPDADLRAAIESQAGPIADRRTLSRFLEPMQSQSGDVTATMARPRRALKPVRMMLGQEGGALVEMAICLPILLLIVTGITTFGLTFNNYLMLTDAVSIGARALAISRSATTDPCAVTVQAIEAAAPYLTPSQLTFTFILNGNPALKGPSCSSSSTTTGAAGQLVQGKAATVIVTYPCNLSVYGANLSPGCTLTSQTTELVQ